MYTQRDIQKHTNTKKPTHTHTDRHTHTKGASLCISWLHRLGGGHSCISSLLQY